VVGATWIDLRVDDRTARHLADDDHATLAQRYRLGSGPVAQDRLGQRRGVTRGQVLVDALVPGRRRRGAGGRGGTLGVLDLAQPLLGQFGGTLGPGLLGADRLELARDLALLALGLFLALALGEVDLLLAALLFLLARGLARSLGLALAAFLLAAVRVGVPLLRLPP